VLNIVNPIRIEDGHVIIEARTGKKIYLKAGTEAVINGTGVGIGKSPEVKLDVIGGAWPIRANQGSGAGNAVGLYLQNYKSDTYSVTLKSNYDHSHSMSLSAQPGEILGVYSGKTVLGMNGNVGIGITPSYLFHVDGDVGIQRKLYVTFGDDLWTPLDIDFPDVSTAACPVRFYRYTNTSAGRQLRIYKGDNTDTETVRLDANTGEISYHSLNDWTCANFKDYSDDELIKIIDLHPRNDGIFHKSNPNGKAFPHIDFSKVHDDIATIAEEDRLVGPVYRYDEKKKDFIETKMQYKKGEKSGIDFGSLVYAMAEIVLRMNNRISQLEEQINEIRQRINN